MGGASAVGDALFVELWRCAGADALSEGKEKEWKRWCSAGFGGAARQAAASGNDSREECA